MKFKIGEMVGILDRIDDTPSQRRCIILSIGEKFLFDSVKWVKTWEIGDERSYFQLSDRIYKL